MGFGGIHAEHTGKGKIPDLIFSVFCLGFSLAFRCLFYKGGNLRRVLLLTSWFVVVESALLSMFVFAMLAGAEVTPATAIIGAVAAGAILLGAGLAATGKPRVAARINLWAVPITPVLFLLLPFEFRSLGSFLVICGAVAIPGLFWLFAARRNWPSPMSKSFLLRRPGLTGGLGAGVFVTLVAGALFCSLAVPWWGPGDCGGGRLLDERGVPRNTDFTARVLFVGPKTFLHRSLWSIARVEQRFSAPWLPNIVTVRGFFEPGDKAVSYFVEGSRSHGALLRFLPIMEPVPCGRTQPAQDAEVALRILHDGPPKVGVRLIGRVYQEKSKRPGVKVGVSVEGSAGTTFSVTDAQGVYDLNGLPPGRYTVGMHLQDAQGRPLAHFGVWDFNLKTGELREADIRLP